MVPAWRDQCKCEDFIDLLGEKFVPELWWQNVERVTKMSSMYDHLFVYYRVIFLTKLPSFLGRDCYVTSKIVDLQENELSTFSKIIISLD